ncbi:hypothetical protein [Mucilaginibacter terrigena]|uniref:hypothetical protein n=1 Tax=Mucilaginibacter terrigena TaxID=2492395 RepID=UPI00193A273C|nr:hypothetical protein [Mucilaginibacter terrigena]
MKTQETKNNVSGQGSSTADRAHIDAKETQKQKGISNGGGQRSDQTSNRDNTRKHENKH